MPAPTSPGPSLESLLEGGRLGLEVLHPGGLETTAELAALCNLGPGARVLDVASGTGESACFLVQELEVRLTALDHSPAMVRRALAKSRRRGLALSVIRGDAHHLPFHSGSFDAAICECTLSLLDGERVIGEMVRVVRCGGSVGFHEICWTQEAPRELQEELCRLEGERPRTLRGWRELMERFDVTKVRAYDRSSLLSTWMKESRRTLGAAGVARLGVEVLRTWGISGLWRLLRSERIFRSEHLGYGTVVARKA